MSKKFTSCVPFSQEANGERCSFKIRDSIKKERIWEKDNGIQNKRHKKSHEDDDVEIASMTAGQLPKEHPKWSRSDGISRKIKLVI